jgi:hypothetical protein
LNSYSDGAQNGVFLVNVEARRSNAEFEIAETKNLVIDPDCRVLGDN